MLDAIIEFVEGQLGTFGKYILFPIFVALIFLLMAELYSRWKGVPLSVEFHKKSFALAVAVVFGWLVYLLIPEGVYLPMEALEVKFVYGLFMLILSIQYLVFLLAELVSPTKTILTLGAGAGLLRTTLAIGQVAPMCAENEEMSYHGASSVMLANTVMVLRNLLIIVAVGIWLGLFVVPPLYFLAPMLLMLLSCGVISFIWYKQGAGTAEEVEYSPISVHGMILFVVLFLVMYYAALGVLEYSGFLGFYSLSGVAGFLYGSAHLFIVASMLFTEVITLKTALYAGIIVTAGSIFSDVPYAFFAGAGKLAKILLVSEIIPIIIGVITLAYLVY